MSLDEAERILDNQLRKLSLADEEDQKSYKILDYTIRTSTSVTSMVQTKIKIEHIRQKAGHKKNIIKRIIVDK